MTVEDLIAELESLPQDAEVRIASQPSWPFENAVAGVTGPEAMLDEALSEIELEYPGDEDEAREALEEAIGNIVYIGEGRQLGYLPGTAKIAFDGSGY